MDWLYLALIIGLVLVSAALVHGFERLRGGTDRSASQPGGSAP